MTDYQLGKLIYDNPLASPEDVKGFRLEGEAKITFPNGRLRMENARDPSEGQKSNFVYWCPNDFPADVAISWDFHPVREPGLCILFFAAKGIKGEDIFDPNLAKRTGDYQQYHHGDIDALHVSCFRRTFPEERAFHTCNLRKSYGFHLVCQGADPIPSVEDAKPPYRICVVKCGSEVAFLINDLPIFTWIDDGKTYGPPLAGGKIGFRQMAPLVAEYANLPDIDSGLQKALANVGKRGFFDGAAQIAIIRALQMVGSPLQYLIPSNERTCARFAMTLDRKGDQIPEWRDVDRRAVVPGDLLAVAETGPSFQRLA